MHSGLQRDATARHLPKHFFIAFGVVPSFVPEAFPRFIQHAIPSRSIPQIQTDRQFLLAKILALLCPYSANLFIAGLLYLLRFERVDNLERIASRRRPAFSLENNCEKQWVKQLRSAVELL